MENEVDIDTQLETILYSLYRGGVYDGGNEAEDEKDIYMAEATKEIKHLIREVAEEVITTKTKRAKSDYENGWNDCVDTCNENLNRLLGEK